MDSLFNRHTIHHQGLPCDCSYCWYERSNEIVPCVWKKSFHDLHTLYCTQFILQQTSVKITYLTPPNRLNFIRACATYSIQNACFFCLYPISLLCPPSTTTCVEKCPTKNWSHATRGQRMRLRYVGIKVISTITLSMKKSETYACIIAKLRTVSFLGFGVESFDLLLYFDGRLLVS